MGIYRTDYLVFGVKLDDLDTSSDEFYEKNEDVICGKIGAPFNLILDYMGGRAPIAGKIIAQADEPDGFDFLDLSTILGGVDVHDQVRENGKMIQSIRDRLGVNTSDLRLYLFSSFA